MKCWLIKKEIQEVLGKIQGLTNRKTNLFITSTVRLTTYSNDSIRIEATDLETDFSGLYPADIDTEGSVCINAKKFFEIIKNYPSEKILIHEVENRWIEIGEGKLLFHIVGMNPDDFPEIGKDTHDTFIPVDSFLFKKLIEKNLSIPALVDEKRIYNQAVLLESFKDDNGNCLLRGVSTDSRRMIKYDMPSDQLFPFSGDEKSLLIPKKALSELLKFLDTVTPVKIGTHHNRFVVVKDSEIFSITLLEGGFPGYQDIMKFNPDHIILFNRQAFLMSLKRMSILSDDDYKAIIFSFEQNKLLLMTSNPDLGESHEELEILFDRAPFEVAFNPKFFMDALASIEDEMAHIYLRDHESACVIKGATENHFISVIMPIRI